MATTALLWIDVQSSFPAKGYWVETLAAAWEPSLTGSATCPNGTLEAEVAGQMRVNREDVVSLLPSLDSTFS